jgi:menaquinone-dependent protoporphyrinogen IX oxidase
MKTIIAYKTKTGTTKQYAQWLGEALEVRPLSYSEIKPDDLKTCDACVVMSGTYASLMPLTKFLKKHWDLIKDKKVAVVAVGMAPPEVGWSKFSYKQIPKPIREKIKYWKLPGMKDGKMAENLPPVKKENLDPVIEYLGS